MYKAEIEIKNKLGLHARPASRVVAYSQKFKSEALICEENPYKEINLKSIISILSANLGMGKIVELVVTGEDEQIAGPSIAEFIENLSD